MKRTFFSGILALALFPVVIRAASPYYINNGTVAPPDPTPIIDATNFVNTGVFNVISSQNGGYSTANTRNFTNTGSMIGNFGFRLDTTPSASPGMRLMAANFYNGPLLTNGFGTVEAQGIPSYLFITATNITSKGILTVDAGGVMQLVGTNITLARSGIQVKPIAGIGSIITGTNFVNDAGIYDVYWAQANATFPVTTIYNGIFASSPPHVVSSGNATVQALVPFPNGYGYSSTNDLLFNQQGLTLTVTNFSATNIPTTTNIFIITNEIRQAVFVGTNDPNVLVDVSFLPSDSPTNDFKTVIISLSEPATNLVTGLVDNNSIFFIDTLASSTDRGLAQNIATGPGILLNPIATARPANYTLSRAAALFGFGGQPENIDPGPDFLYNPSFVTNRVTGAYAAYSVTLDNLTSRPFNGSVTNNPGRIIISADTLDMTRARIRAEGWLNIEARRLIGNSNAIVDSENLSFELGSPSGNLVIKDMIKTTVLRERGTLRAWSALWNNRYSAVVTNYLADTNNGGAFTIASPITNIVNVGMYALIFDATGLAFNSPLPVNVYKLVLHSTNIVISDPMTVFQNLLFDSTSLTLGNVLNLSGSSSNFFSVNAPKLLFFTNSGAMHVPGDAHFGDDRPPYDTFANYGGIFSGGQLISSTNVFITGGTNFSANTFFMSAKKAYFSRADIESGGEMRLNINSLYLTNTFIHAGGQLTLAVSNVLVDGGWTNASYASSNLVLCDNGFELSQKPLLSDLLGTAFESDAPNFSQIDHIWSGKDLGPVKAGFTNNAAIGRLTLVTSGSNPFFEPLFYFSGTGSSNAIYVDDLDLSRLTYDYHEVFAFNTNLTIYFAYSQGVPPEVLNGEMGGHLRWVTNFCGPYSSTNTMHDGTNLFPVNRGLVESTNIDSDGDTFMNGSDSSPFDPPFNIGTLKIKIAPSVQPGKQDLNQSTGSYDISWYADAKGIYQVQYANTFPPSWVTLVTYTNTATPQTVIITDKPPVGTSRRFYRVGLSGYSP